MNNITEDVAKAAWATTGKQGKSVLENLFGKELFAPKITDLVTTYAEALALIGKPRDNKKSRTAQDELEVIAQALNGDWTPNWDDKDEYKYFPYFEKTKSGFVFASVDYVNTITCVPPRLCFRSRELAEYAGKKFQPLYNRYLS